jgi:predicted Zn-dependent protease
MTSPLIANLQKLVGTARDNAVLRFSLGAEYLKLAEFEQAIEQFRAALDKDPRYSAAWKLLGEACSRSGKLSEALSAYREGETVARQKGDIQAAKEMRVFARRVEKQLEAQGSG